MITQRFRSLVWVAGAAVAATGLYIVSLQVAAERGRLEAIDKEIAKAERDIRQLQTELGTRASMRQLERWNGEVLALSAPSAKQFLGDESDLRVVDGSSLPTDGFAPPPVMVASATRELIEPEAAEAPIASAPTARRDAPKSAPVEKPRSSEKAKIVAAALPPPPKKARVAMLDKKLVDQRTFAEIMRTAESEKAAKAKSAP